MPVTRAAIADLPDLSSVRIACSMHLEIKMIPAIEGLLNRGASLFLATCNRQTVCDDTVAWCRKAGAEAHAWRGMNFDDLAVADERACAFRPTHLCEMGADLAVRLLRDDAVEWRRGVRAGLEATGSGTTRLAGLEPAYPIFNWDDLPIKEGLHNRRMVGLVACHAFFEKTRLTMHGKRVLVLGYGLVGRGVCDAVRAYGGEVAVSEVDAGRALEARFAGERIVDAIDFLPHADIVFSATGARNVLGETAFARLKPGAFLINVGHCDTEIDVAALLAFPNNEVRPFVRRVALPQGGVYLFANGSMANLTAGQGDSLNAFDITAAAMVAGIGFMVAKGAAYRPGVHLLPKEAWTGVAAMAMGRRLG